MKKKFMSIMLCLILAFALTACGSSEPETEAVTEAQSEQTALEAAEAYLEKGLNLNPGDLRVHLEMGGYSDEEVELALENCGADWNAYALDTANSYISLFNEDEDQLREDLEYMEFSSDVIDYAIENADWSAEEET